MSNNTVVTLKKSTTSGVEPAAVSLYQAELAINTADADLFTKRDDGVVLKQSIGTVHSGDYTSSSTGVKDIDIFDATLYRSAKYVFQATSGSAYQTIEMLVMHNGVDVYVTRYGLIKTGSELATFTAEYSSTPDIVTIKADVVNAITTIKWTRTLVQA